MEVRVGNIWKEWQGQDLRAGEPEARLRQTRLTAAFTLWWVRTLSCLQWTGWAQGWSRSGVQACRLSVPHLFGVREAQLALMPRSTISVTEGRARRV